MPIYDLRKIICAKTNISLSQGCSMPILKNVIVYLLKLVSPFPKDAPYQIVIHLDQWYLRRFVLRVLCLKKLCLPSAKVI